MRNKLDEVLAQIQGRRIDIDHMKAEQKFCQDTFGVALKLRDYSQFWPRAFDVNTFVKIEGDLLSLDAAVDLARQRVSTAESLAKDIAGYLKLDDMYRRLNEPPPPGKNGQTLTEAIYEAYDEVMLCLEEVPLIRAEITATVTDMRSLLG